MQQAATHTATQSKLNADYIHRRKGSNIWYTRIRIPQDLVGNSAFLSNKGLHKKELTKTTGKVVRREALIVAEATLSEWEQEFSLLRGEDLSVQKTPTLVSKPLIPPVNLDFSFAGKNAKACEELFHELVSLAVHKELSDTGRFDEVRDDFIIKNIDKIDAGQLEDLRVSVSEPDYQRLWMHSVRGKLGGSSRAIQFGHMTSREMKSSTGITFGEVLRVYIEKRGKNESRKSAIKHVETVAGLFADNCLPYGLRTLQKDITKNHVRKFVELVQERWSGSKTCSDAISLLSTICRYGITALGTDESNPFENATALLPKVKVGVRKSSSNKAYELEQLRKMIPDLASYSSRGQGNVTKIIFPVALMALYTGMRLEEICRVKKREIITIEGIDVIRLSYSKSQAGIRDVPINRGCKLAVDWLLNHSDDEYLVSGLHFYDDRRSKKISDRFSAWKGVFFSDLVTSREFTFHSFRSTAITVLDRAKVGNDCISLLVGHEDGRGTMAKRTYSSGWLINDLVEPASKIDYGDSLYAMAEELLAKHAS